MLAKRAAQLSAKPPSIVSAHFRCAEDVFDAVTNPSGFINFGTSQNYLLWDLLAPKISAAESLTEAETHYDFLYGSARLRKTLAQFMGRLSGAKPIDAEALTVTSGASAALEMLLYCLCEPTDGVLIPAPYYAGFDFDLEARIGVKPLAVYLEGGITKSLEAALLAAEAQGTEAKALLVTNPCNPTGQVYDLAALSEMESFCRQHGLHCIFDEIYAHSCFGSTAMVSALSLFNSKNVHVLYGFAKDFGLSGLKVGVVHTLDEDLQLALRALAYFSPVSTQTQHLLAQLLEDHLWVDNLLEQNKRRLSEAYHFTTLAMQRYGIPFLRAEAGLFLMIDLRSKLSAATPAAEMELWESLLQAGQVNISPGNHFKFRQPGWYRLCYAHPQSTLRHGVVRLQDGLLSAAKIVVSTASRCVPC